MDENKEFTDIKPEQLAEAFDVSSADFSGAQEVIIKSIGVGGGGSNAVSHMYRQGIDNVQFVVLNTDLQALRTSPVPNKVLIGAGRGAGGVPPRAAEAAESDIAKIEALFEDGTCMVFITAGMGGGTGTGAAPVVARVARERGVLTIGIVTIPFFFEGRRKILQALNGVKEMQQYVDALLVINNERLTEIYGDLTFETGMAKSDDTLSLAARSISELITGDGYINLDFEDVKSTLLNGGAAIISTGYGEGEDRVNKAIQDALHSPLLRNREIMSSKRLLLNLYFARDKFKMSEMNALTDFVNEIDPEVEVIWGAKFDDSLGDKVKMTILAAGFEDSVEREVETSAPRRKTDSADKGQTAKPQIDEKVEDTLEKEYGQQIEQYRSGYLVLTPAEMDSDAVIEVLEKTPTYRRDKNVIDELRRRIQLSATPAPAAGAAPASSGRQIDFF